MEFNEKLHRLRKERGITQEELAGALYVSRTAVSKWESGRGYPSIESLRAIAKYFSVSIDDLLSADEIITVAQEEQKSKNERLRDIVFGTVDIFYSLFAFLPLFAERSEDVVRSVSLLSASSINPYISVLYFTLVGLTFCFGILTYALQNSEIAFWMRVKTYASLTLGALALVCFIAALHPYAALLSFILLFIKVWSLYVLKNR